MAIAMKVTVAPDRISLRPGETADVELTIQNASQVVEHFAGSVVGLPSNDLYTCEPEVVKLRPKEVGTLRMKISVPDRGGMVAGPYTLGLVVKSPYSQEVSRCEELPLDVQPAPSLTMQVQPEVATGGKTAHYGVNMANEGNMPMAVTLSGSDPENRVGFKFEPKQMRLEPGQAAGANVMVNSDRPLTGQDIRRSVTLRANAGETTVEKPLTFVQTPRIKGGMMKFGALAAGLAVLGGLTYGGAKMLRDLKTQNAAVQTPIVQGTNGNGTGQQGTGQQGGGQTSTPPASTGGQQGSQPPPPPPPSSPTPQQGQNGTVANNPNVPTSVYIDFTLDNNLQPWTIPQKGIDSNYYGTQGMLMRNDNASATTPDCRTLGTQQTIRYIGTPNPPDPQRFPAAGAGYVLGSSKVNDLSQCASLPITMSLGQPLSAVRVWYAGLPNTNYIAQFTLQDGTVIPITQPGPPQITTSAIIGYEVPQGSKNFITSVTFGHVRGTGNPQVDVDSQFNWTMLKKIGWTVAAH